ncbi:TPA: hypothetical protein KOR49_002332 [Clostridioides difficile]|uniref:Uncharacterized protein n=1 Tax=Clostridioides difficile TaxID=1496 RepID=A0AAN5VQ88_CLODI|nr:hypothetical protein [Clostridioides difficile]EGT3945608.1 hypothetical protein [Clostridioides difficile]MBG0198920.1 hypothetical protein [Clostridioides difficile]MCA0574526.1 hypothetical protein [Clostridioides difficile]PBG30534.1 hypothetical protein BGU81_02710 [Clostridioides difficile]CCL32245.1 hypothetical protein BN174_3800010 [Clostridioides difficile E15]
MILSRYKKIVNFKFHKSDKIKNELMNNIKKAVDINKSILICNKNQIEFEYEGYIYTINKFLQEHHKDEYYKKNSDFYESLFNEIMCFDDKDIGVRIIKKEKIALSLFSKLYRDESVKFLEVYSKEFIKNKKRLLMKKSNI